ncbi:trypsin-1-like [Athalia rosae]|uniref:trypsin-1-like n=1 Tax=Athalia rosae TaxID=37344 RepID=UPI002033DF6A|nr:trypsin-1-like [Athalia rosae]
MWLTTTLIISVGLSACSAFPSHVIPAPVSGRIVNGTTAKPGERPFQVSLQRLSRFHFCGGSVLNANYVITAGHCVEGESARWLLVVAGTNDVFDYDQGIVRSVRRIKIHENYNAADAWRNDIALLELAEPLLEIPNVVRYVKLPSADQSLKTGDAAVVSGWGRDRSGGQSPKLLQIVTIEISDQDYCKRIYVAEAGLEVSDSQVCADVPEGGKGSCQGDSGGPLTVNDELTGLVSWAAGCAQRGYPTVFTRVAEFLDWIAENAV